MRLKRCPNCGRNEPRDAMACSGCRSTFAFRATRRRVEPAVLPRPVQYVAPAPHDISCAVLASMFVPGAGQMYNLQFVKAAFLFAVSSVTMLIGVWLWAPLALLVSVALWTVSMIDAAYIAGRLNDHEQVTPYQWF